MCYAAYKLWNVCNYERTNYKNLGLEKYPDWYDQKSKHKDDLWFKSLPSQTAQEICKLLDKSWKSFYRLKESGGIENPGTPRYKKDKMPITYMQNGIQHENGSYNVRLSLPKKLKEYMAHTYDIRAAYLYLKNPVFSNNDFCVGAFCIAGKPKSGIVQDPGGCFRINFILHRFNIALILHFTFVR